MPPLVEQLRLPLTTAHPSAPSAIRKTVGSVEAFRKLDLDLNLRGATWDHLIRYSPSHLARVCPPTPDPNPSRCDGTTAQPNSADSQPCARSGEASVLRGWSRPATGRKTRYDARVTALCRLRVRRELWRARSFEIWSWGRSARRPTRCLSAEKLRTGARSGAPACARASSREDEQQTQDVQVDGADEHQPGCGTSRQLNHKLCLSGPSRSSASADERYLRLRLVLLVVSLAIAENNRDRRE